ncbi:MAG: hypothetical protein FJ088_08995, partial [Deltaproteobacteria bacterium]|nr:hypothetical protein [Deltaproteobacteria bacterium]
MRKIIHSIFMVLFYASPAPANSEFGGVKKIADELVGGKFHKISFDPACPDELNWKQVSDGKGVTGVRVSSGGKKLLFLFKRQGSFYNEFLPEPSVKMDYKEISKEIKKFEKELKKDKFPSPKHRYGAEAELAWLKSQMKKKAFSSQFLGISGDYLIFSGPGLGKMETDVRNALDKESQQATVQETSEKYEGMGEIRKISEDALEVSPLPYSHKRPYPADLFEKFPGVKTIIMQSVDAHALGPSGIQIENRKPLPALITGVYLPYFPEGAQKDKMKPLPALTLEITPPAEIIEGIPASFSITL